jgi:hypothetical protein
LDSDEVSDAGAALQIPREPIPNSITVA